MEAVLPAFTRETGVVVNACFGPTNALLQRIGQGPLPGVFAGMAGSVEASPSSSAFHLPSSQPLVRSGIGVAVSADSPTPDISSVGQLIDLLLKARSVAYSRRGPSGIYFAGLLKELGIADEVNGRSTLVDEGPTAYALLDGRADIAIHQLSELMLVPQAKLVGPLPAAVQHYTDFSVLVAREALHREPAFSLIEFLAGPLASRAYADSGLQPIGLAAAHATTAPQR